MSNTTGKLLAALTSSTSRTHAVIDAIVDAHHAEPWGALLVLHSDLDPETRTVWMGRVQDRGPWSLDALREMTISRIAEQCRIRHDAVNAATVLVEARGMDHARGVIRGDKARSIVRDAMQQLSQAREEDWPRCDGQRLVRCADVLLRELQEDDRCECCGGLGYVYTEINGVHVATDQCAACRGTGYTRISDTERATRIGVARSTYQRAWRRPYEWLHDTAQQARRRAARIVREGSSV